MQEFRIKFTQEQLFELEHTIHSTLLTSKELMQTPWLESLEFYVLGQIWKRIQAKCAQMERALKQEGTMKFNQIEIDIITKTIHPRNQTDGYLYGEFLRRVSGRNDLIA